MKSRSNREAWEAVIVAAAEARSASLAERRQARADLFPVLVELLELVLDTGAAVQVQVDGLPGSVFRELLEKTLPQAERVSQPFGVFGIRYHAKPAPGVSVSLHTHYLDQGEPERPSPAVRVVSETGGSVVGPSPVSEAPRSPRTKEAVRPLRENQ